MSSNIPIVQGIAVADGNSGAKYPQSYHDYNYIPSNQGSYTVQDLQQLRTSPNKQFQDVIWAVLFIAHLIAIIVVIAFNIGVGSTVNGNIIFVTCTTGLAAVGLSSMSLSFMMQHAKTLVETALIFSVCTSLAIGIIGFMIGSILMGCLGLLSFAIGCCYAKVVWPRIPFAAANLNTALTAVRANMGLTVVSFGFTLLAFVWTILWFLGVGGALSGGSNIVIFLLFLSYYWVHQVLQNTMHVTTAGVVGTWWWVPSEASTCWSTALSDSVARATTYSFGSVCFGSLLVAIVQALRALEYQTRDSDDMKILSCIIQCILSCIEGIIESLNRWAYVYVGLYGFGYLEAGRNVIQLFENKGWTAIIADDLADNVLVMMSVAIAFASGLVGLVIGFFDSSMFVNLGFEHAAGPAFFIGFLAGFLFATIIMSVVGSAVNTVIVCFAEDPAAFELNHPQLSSEMRASWAQAWPGLVD